MIIKEQKTFDDYINDGFREGKPADYNKNIKLYQKIGVDGKVLYKRKDGKPIETPKINYDALVGTYITDVPSIKKVRVYKGKDENGEESLYLSSIYLEKIPQLKNYIISKLTPNKNNQLVFSISNKSGEELVDAITFSSNKFVFKYSVLGRSFEIIATKEDVTKVSDEVTPPTPVKTKTDNTIVKKDKDDEIPVVRSKPLYFNNDKKDDTPTKSCNDFPFTLGCVNSKIGDLNAKLYSGNRYNDQYTKDLQSNLDNGGNFNRQVNPNKELTKDLWDELMNKQVIKESVKKVLKEYINKKK